MARTVVLFYDPVPSPWAPKLRQLCAIQGLRLQEAAGDRLDQPLEELLQGLPSQPLSPSAGPLPESILLFCGLTGPQLDRLLQGLRKAGIPRSCLKAVLTPTNAKWSLRTLYEELVQEREQLS